MKRASFIAGATLIACSTTGGADPEDSADEAWTVPECERPHGEIHRPTSIVDAQTRLEGAWTICSGALTAFVPSGTRGIELAEGRLRYLALRDSLLVRSDAAREAHVFDNGGDMDMRFGNVELMHEGDRRNYHFRVAEDGRFLVLEDWVGEARVELVRALPRGATSGRPPAEDEPPPRSAPPPLVDTCPPITEAIELRSEIAVRERLGGKWRLCAGTLIGPADTRGIDLGSDVAFGLVDVGGVLVRGPNWDYSFDVRLLSGTDSGAPTFVLALLNFSNGWSARLRIDASDDVIEFADGTRLRRER